jgi:hypothetical protein
MRAITKVVRGASNLAAGNECLGLWLGRQIRRCHWQRTVLDWRRDLDQ